MKDKVIAIDFDGTCVTHEYPEIGKDIGAIPVLKRIVESGGRLILWTMRSDGRDSLDKRGIVQHKNPLSDAIRWFEENGIPLYGIQRNPTQDEWTRSPKAYAHIYIDDAALGCPLIKIDGSRPFVDWKTVERMLFGNNLCQHG